MKRALTFKSLNLQICLLSVWHLDGKNSLVVPGQRDIHLSSSRARVFAILAPTWWNLCQHLEVQGILHHLVSKKNRSCAFRMALTKWTEWHLLNERESVINIKESVINTKVPKWVMKLFYENKQLLNYWSTLSLNTQSLLCTFQQASSR